MTADQILDTRGLSCPQPAMLARQALQRRSQGRLEVLVDCGTARDNVTRMAARAGWSVREEEVGGDDVRLVLTR